MKKNFVTFEDEPTPIINFNRCTNCHFPQVLRRVETITKIMVENRANKPIEKFLVNHPNHSPVSEVEIEGG